MKEKNFILQDGSYFVYASKSDYLVYKLKSKNLEKCATIGLLLGIDAVKKEIARRQNKDRLK